MHGWSLRTASHDVVQLFVATPYFDTCQTLGSVTLASGKLRIMLSSRLFQPESWTRDDARMDKACVLADTSCYGLSAPLQPMGFRQRYKGRGYFDGLPEDLDGSAPFLRAAMRYIWKGHFDRNGSGRYGMKRNHAPHVLRWSWLSHFYRWRDGRVSQRNRN